MKVTFKILAFMWVTVSNQLFYKHYYKRLPGGSDGKKSACSGDDLGSMHASGRFPGEGNGYLP